MKRNLIAAAAHCGHSGAAGAGRQYRRRVGKREGAGAPTLKPVTVDPKTTALLMLDFMKQNCGKRPRCLATIPAMKKLLGEARAAKVPVVYSHRLPTARRPTSSRTWRRRQASRIGPRPARTNS